MTFFVPLTGATFEFRGFGTIGPLIPVDRWSHKQLRRAHRLAEKMLIGVGDPTEKRIEVSHVALHYRRVASPQEIFDITKRPGTAAELAARVP